MTTTKIDYPSVVSRSQWLDARKKLLGEEKELTRARDQLNAERRRLPMVEVEAPYVFEGPEGKLRLVDLFEGRHQLVVYHFMWLWEEGQPLDRGCPSCSGWADEIARDYHVTLDENVAPLEYNYRPAAQHRDAGTGYYFEGQQPFDLPGLSCFLRQGERVYHTYSTYGRGAESVGGTYYLLDLTALGRQEDWEEPKGRATGLGAQAGSEGIRYPDQYDDAKGSASKS